MTHDVMPTNASADNDPLWTVQEVAAYVRTDPETVRRCIRRGFLDAVRYNTGASRGGNYRIRRSAVHKWLGMTVA